jgi:hypothetical protein
VRFLTHKYGIILNKYLVMNLNLRKNCLKIKIPQNPIRKKSIYLRFKLNKNEPDKKITWFDILCPSILLKDKKKRMKLAFYEKRIKTQLSLEYILKNMNNVEKLIEIVFNDYQRKAFNITNLDVKIEQKSLKNYCFEEIDEAFKSIMMNSDIISKNLINLNVKGF